VRPIDLSHSVEHGMVTYRGLPASAIRDFLSREASREIDAPGTVVAVSWSRAIARDPFCGGED
jgi:kynurenine formamidase